MVMGKRAQFFLLAAVIISAVVISLGITANRATVNREPGNFYDFSYEVKRESGAVLDYEIYTDITSDDQDQPLEEFVDLLATDIRDKNPDANFVFLYGDNDSMIFRNYGSEDAFGEGDLATGAGAVAISSICYGGSCELITTDFSTFDEGAGYLDLGAVGDEVGVVVEGNDYEFPVSEHRQVIFIMQKGVGDESFVAVS